MALTDGSVIYNIPATLTINGNVYVPENLRIDRGSTVNETQDKDGADNSAYGVEKTPTGTVTLQMTDATAIPPVCAQAGVFALDVKGGTAENWWITSVGQTYSQGNAYKIDCAIRKAISVTPTP